MKLSAVIKISRFLSLKRFPGKKVCQHRKIYFVKYFQTSKLTISENSWRRYLDSINHSDMVENSNSVPMDLCVMYEGSNVNTLG